MTAPELLAIVSQCSTGPCPGRARQIECSSRAGEAFANRKVSSPLCASKFASLYSHLVAVELPCCATVGISASGAGASSQFTPPLVDPTCVTTGTPSCTAITTVVSSVLKRQDWSLFAD